MVTGLKTLPDYWYIEVGSNPICDVIEYILQVDKKFKDKYEDFLKHHLRFRYPTTITFIGFNKDEGYWFSIDNYSISYRYKRKISISEFEKAILNDNVVNKAIINELYPIY